MTPYNNIELQNNLGSDVYYFYLSQLQIRIEQEFGLLVGKWRIFTQPLATKLPNAPQIISACMRLHNFCINQRIEKDGFDIAAEITDVQALNNVTELSY